jgi:hypothetical protein
MWLVATIFHWAGLDYIFERETLYMKEELLFLFFFIFYFLKEELLEKELA